MLLSNFIKLCFFVLFVFTICETKAQKLREKTANNLFENMNYYDAFPIYNELASKKNASYEVIQRAGITAYNLIDYVNAEIYFKKIVANYSSQFTTDDAIHLFQALRYNGKYDEVKSFIITLKSKNTHLKWQELYAKFPDYITDIKKDSSLYTITNIESINTEYSEFAPYLDVKKNQLLFSSNRKNSYSENKMFSWDNTYFIDSYTAKKQDSLHFEPAISLGGDFKTNLHDGPTAVTNNGTKLFVTRTYNETKKEANLSAGKTGNIPVIKRFDIIIYTKNSDGKWDEGTKFPYCSREYSVGNPSLTDNGNRMYFSSDMPGGYGKSDIWYSDYKNNEWQKPINLGANVNTEERETFPYIFENDILFFASDGRASLGGLDIYFCTPTLDEYFEPKALSYPINTKYDDFGLFLNSNFRNGYIASNRLGGKGKDDIYFFNSKISIIDLKERGKVYDWNTKLPINNARVFLLDPYFEKLDSTLTPNTGAFEMNVKQLGKYKLGVKERTRFYDKIVAVDTLKVGKHERVIYLYPKYRFSLKVQDSLTNDIIPSATVTLVYKNKALKEEGVTDKLGYIYNLLRNYKMRDKVEIDLIIEKEGYQKKIVPKSFILDTAVIVNSFIKLIKKKEISYELEIVDEQGNPIIAQIEIVNNTTNASVYKKKPNGRERISLKSGENYGISVAADGYLFQSENLDIPEDAEYSKVKRIVLKRLTKGSNIVLNNVFFDHARATLSPSSINELNRLYDILVSNPSMKIELSGHTDNSGSKITNKKLSLARAKSVVDYLISKGIGANRLTSVGYGFDKPVASNLTEEGRQLNRRTELKILEIN